MPKRQEASSPFLPGYAASRHLQRLYPAEEGAQLALCTLPFQGCTSWAFSRDSPAWVVATVLAAAAKEPRSCAEPAFSIALCHGDSESNKEQGDPRITGLELVLTHRHCSGNRQAQEITYKVPMKIKYISWCKFCSLKQLSDLFFLIFSSICINSYWEHVFSYLH